MRRAFLRTAACLPLLLAPIAAWAQAAAPGKPPEPAALPPVQIDRNGVLILVRSTLLALDQANRTGNYTVLRDLGAPGFQAANTAAKLGDIFANLRAQNLDLSGVAVLDPQLTVLPTPMQGGMMRMAGFFPSVPSQVNFELIYAAVDGRWRLFGIGLNVGQAGPVAPAAPETSEVRAEPKVEAKPAQPQPPMAGGTRPPPPRPRTP